ncbi:protein F-like protein [Aeromonas phage ZPAH7B]|uniref:Uncharacterized protein n=2 Tax=Aerosvirus ZPAH7 TaxID=2733366 RepID=A0A3S9QIC5_9CAUD|nr:hypothetical protein HOU89_gp01 [Aeromonas phage ZPAH7]AZQ96382.1 hypothetical protein ZPAH7_orf00001 [Aeromonas phage ZPAH7]QAX95962.1 protein F-like protein [Aeromonas phage ZPAH7B]
MALVALCGLLGTAAWHYKGKADVASEKLTGLTREYVQLESQFTAYTDQVESAEKQASNTRKDRDKIRERTDEAIRRIEQVPTPGDALVDPRVVDELRYASCRTQGNPSACTRGPHSAYSGTGD